MESPPVCPLGRDLSLFYRNIGKYSQHALRYRGGPVVVIAVAAGFLLTVRVSINIVLTRQRVLHVYNFYKAYTKKVYGLLSLSNFEDRGV